MSKEAGMQDQELNKTERDIVAPFRKVNGWPTLCLWIGILLGQVAVFVAASLGTLHYLLAAALLGPLAYMHYTPIHEAIHGNIRLTAKQPPWVTLLVSWISPIWLFSTFPYLHRSHLGHHA